MAIKVLKRREKRFKAASVKESKRGGKDEREIATVFESRAWRNSKPRNSLLDAWEA